MRSKKVKLIYFSLGGTEIKQFSIDWKTLIALATVGITIILLFVSVTIGLIADAYQKQKIAHLTQSNRTLMASIRDLAKNATSFESDIQKIEQTENDLRIFVDLPPMDSDIRKLGVGGQSQSLPTSLHSGTAANNEQVQKINTVLQNLNDRIHLTAESRQEIRKKYYERLREIKQTPSIRPLSGGRVTDRFGYRLDPFIDRFAHHDGVDFSAPRGTDVFASADGVVEEIASQYRPNYSYGKYIVVDHGYGRKTRYAHLETILVKEGQKINRHTIIGKVGDTGKSTGPHLHYEVLVDGKATDPETFMLD